MRLVVTGAGGLLGSEVLVEAQRRRVDVVGTQRADLDITDVDAVHEALGQLRPEVIVHCAAFTAVDAAEDDPEQAMRVNRDATQHIADAARAVNARLVFVSTDYVFDGEKREPYTPEDEPNPLNHYGRSKLAGERIALDAPGSLVARVSWLYGWARPCFASAMIDRVERGDVPAVVEDQIGGPGSAREIARTLLDLVDLDATGLFHVRDRGACSRAEFADAAIALSGSDVRVRRIRFADVPPEAPRPRYSVLDVGKTEEAVGRELPNWEAALADFVRAGATA